MKIKNTEITGFAALAPMAGVADRAMREMGVSQRKKGVSDMLAAAFILQGYIESVY